MGNIRLFLRANEKIYINGAVVRFDRKTSIELLNDVSFLLENHVMQVEDATTPLRQLYFVVQMMLIDPGEVDAPMRLCNTMLAELKQAVETEELLEGVRTVEGELAAGDTFKALKSIRRLFDVEDRAMQGIPPNTGIGSIFEGALALKQEA